MEGSCKNNLLNKRVITEALSLSISFQPSVHRTHGTCLIVCCINIYKVSSKEAVTSYPPLSQDFDSRR